MSSNSEVDTIVAVLPHPPVFETLPAGEPATEPMAPEPGPAVHAIAAPVPAKRGRPGWVAPAAVAAAGLIASGTLSYFLYSTTSQRDAVRHQLATTQATLASTKGELATAQRDAAARKIVADYVSLYIADHGRVQTSYQVWTNCNHYSECRTAAQQLLTDMQKFQSDRSSANVPDALVNSDSMLGDALSAAIAATQELITSADNSNLAKFKSSIQKLDAAMLNMAKAESALGTAVH